MALFSRFPSRCRPAPVMGHLLIRDDPTGEFGPGNARWRIAARYRWARPTPGPGCGTA
jgi:hypothetical protein